MHRRMLHNDQICDTSDAILAAGQAGLVTGWGIFSTIRVYDGVLFAWERHLARMRHDARLMRVPFPAAPEQLEANLYRLLEANGVVNGSLRLIVVRNRGGLFSGSHPMPDSDVIAFTAQVNDWGDRVRLGLVPNARHAANEFAGVKYLSWAQNLTWYERAHEQGLDEVILLNERGEVAECTSANIFAARGEEIWTPPLISGCLPGVTRAVLLEEVRIPGFRVVERTMLPGDLEAASELFITSSTRELLPVESVEGLQIRYGRSVCDRVLEVLRSFVQSYVGAHRASSAGLRIPI